MKYVKIAQVVSEKKTFKIYIILYIYMTQWQGQITPKGQNFDFNQKRFTSLIIHCKF